MVLNIRDYIFQLVLHDLTAGLVKSGSRDWDVSKAKAQSRFRARHSHLSNERLTNTIKEY